MNAFVAYSIPIKGLKVGFHKFNFNIDSAFFALFEGSPIEIGDLNFSVELDRRSDMLLFDFEMTGYTRTECDRCTAMINLPLEDTRQLIVKFGDSEGETEDEVVFIHPESSEFNVAKYLYEFAVLALPITNVYECQEEANPPCNFEVLRHLSQDESDSNSSSVWDALKNLKDK
ncbi:MAG: DUF177 domain-containing protein [Saprospiraceae bacterium]|nr:DUF177 domain-containing protein [Saprospiraceae bacterium]